MQKLCNEKEPNVPRHILNFAPRVFRALERRAVASATANVVARNFGAIRSHEKVREREDEEADSHDADAIADPFEL
jgi:hypothetical protein